MLNLTGHAKLVTTVAITSESTRLASGSEDTTIKIWDTGSGRQLITLKGHKKVVTKVTFSPDDARLASCSEDGTIKLWDAVTGRELTTLEGSTAEVTYVAFSPDGTQLASVSRDFKIKLWDVVSGKEQRNLYSTDPVARVAFSPDGKRLAGESWLGQIMMWDTTTGGYFFLEPVGTDFAAFQKRYESTAAPREWLEHIPREVSCDGSLRFHMEDKSVSLQNTISPNLNLAERLRNGILELSGRELSFEHLSDSQGLSFQMLPVWNDTLAQLANSNLTPAKRAELQMQLCAKSGQHRAATAQWQRLQRGEWPGFEASIVPKEQSPATVPDDSTIRRLYLITLIDATRRGDVIGHATACQTAAQIAPVLTKEMMALPTVSLGLMSLMRSLQKDGSPDMAGPRETLLKRLEEFASKEWLEVLHTSVAE